MGVVFLIYIGLSVKTALSFHIVRITPSPSSISVISPEMSVQFNESLDNGIVVKSPDNIISSYRISSKNVTIMFSLPLSPNQLYKIAITNISSAGGRKLANQLILIRPKFVNSKHLTKVQSETFLSQQKQYDNNIFGNPLFQLLPFTGPNFEYQISYTVGTDSQVNSIPVIFITSETTQGQNDALAWLYSLGYSKSNLNIQMVMGQP